MYNDGDINKIDQYFNSQYHYMKKNVAPFIDNEYALNPLWSWSQHINAEQAAEYVRDYVAIPNGVKHIQKKVVDIKSADDSQIDYLILEDGEKIYGDLFIDASGFHRLLTRKLGWKEKLYDCAPVSSAWVCQLNYNDPEKEMVNYTQSIAQSNGWLFKIGLWHRMGSGYCYSPSHQSDADSLIDYHNMVDNKKMDPRKISWTPSRLEKIAQGNVAAIGLSCGFIEPMEANALYIIINSLRRLADVIDLFPMTQKFNFDL
jgi:tryptophan halogenase